MYAVLLYAIQLISQLLLLNNCNKYSWPGGLYSSSVQHYKAEKYLHPLHFKNYTTGNTRTSMLNTMLCLCCCIRQVKGKSPPCHPPPPQHCGIACGEGDTQALGSHYNSCCPQPISYTYSTYTAVLGTVARLQQNFPSTVRKIRPNKTKLLTLK